MLSFRDGNGSEIGFGRKKRLVETADDAHRICRKGDHGAGGISAGTVNCTVMRAVPAGICIGFREAATATSVSISACTFRMISALSVFVSSVLRRKSGRAAPCVQYGCK